MDGQLQFLFIIFMGLPKSIEIEVDSTSDHTIIMYPYMIFTIKTIIDNVGI